MPDNIKATVNGEEVELSPDQLDMPDGYALVTPNNVPDGYYTKDAMESKIQDRIAKAKKNAESDLLEDESFQRKVLSKKGITLDKDGNPKGLEPDFDPEEWKQQKAKELTEPLKDELNEYKEKMGKLKRSKVSSDIMKAASGTFQEQYVKSFTGNDDPFVVKQFGDMFDVDPETGQTALKDDDGTFAVDGDGSRITPDKYFEQNADKFSDLLQDKRQKSSKFQNGKSGKKIGSWTEEEIDNMSDEEWEEHQEEIKKAAAEGRVN